MARDLHQEFSEYKRVKFRVFLNSVQKIIDNEENREKSTNNTKKENDPVLEISSSEDESGKEYSDPVIKGPSLNRTLSDMYSANSPHFSPNAYHEKNGTTKVRKIDLNPNLPQTSAISSLLFT